MYPEPEYPMNEEELKELIAKAKATGVPCPALEAKLANREYNEPWQEETVELEIVICEGNPKKSKFPEDQYHLPIIKCIKELSN